MFFNRWKRCFISLTAKHLFPTLATCLLHFLCSKVDLSGSFSPLLSLISSVAFFVLILHSRFLSSSMSFSSISPSSSLQLRRGLDRPRRAEKKNWSSRMYRRGRLARRVESGETDGMKIEEEVGKTTRKRLNHSFSLENVLIIKKGTKNLLLS